MTSNRSFLVVPYTFRERNETGIKNLIDQRHVNHPAIANAQDDFRNRVRNVLQDPRGWRRFDVVFIEEPGNPKALTIQLSPLLRDEDQNHLSFYFPRYHAVCINYFCWMTGGRFFDSNPYAGMTQLLNDVQRCAFVPNPKLDDYRFYVVTHETGHALGLDHPEKKEGTKPGTPGSVMMQMTKGKHHVHPYALNVYPLDSDNPRSSILASLKRLRFF